MRGYDATIAEHYRKEAAAHGLNATSTMADIRIREKETSVILALVGQALRASCKPRCTVADVGCGNAYTLAALAEAFPEHWFVGFEKSPELLELARKRCAGMENLRVVPADIRRPNFNEGCSYDVLLSQRCLINLLDEGDQRLALANIVEPLSLGGTAIFIESFAEPLVRLNTARDQLDLPPTEPQYHNLYLREGFFDGVGLNPWLQTDPALQPNFLSVHYFIARVLHPLMKTDRSISRNSELVNFFVDAIDRNVGDYSPLKLYCFHRA